MPWVTTATMNTVDRTRIQYALSQTGAKASNTIASARRSPGARWDGTAMPPLSCARVGEVPGPEDAARAQDQDE